MFEIYNKVSYNVGKTITRAYSTSFSLGIYFLKSSIRNHIYSIYGFVRLADEIVDTFHDYNKNELFNLLKNDVYYAINNAISINPVLHSFQKTVHQFNIDEVLIGQFLHSMEMDLEKQFYNRATYEEYILGSAEVVGLMCLKVFTYGDYEKYEELKPYAMSLGRAYQKINFLRDLKDDYENLGRSYFPDVNIQYFNEETKKELIKDIEKDFENGFIGIKKLPKTARFGVFLSYKYYHGLLNKIKAVEPTEILMKRVRISDKRKVYMLFQSALEYKLQLF